MAAINPLIDAYIDKAADFAKPILTHIRNLVHTACPQVEEKIKWGMPHFDYKNEMMCSMASFKKHAVMGFWKASLMKDKKLLENAKEETAMGHLGKITSLKDLPPDKKILSYIKEAMELNDKGIKLPTRDKPKEKTLVIPAFFKKALQANMQAKEYFNSVSFSHKKEYIEWITEAKTEETRNKRMSTAIEWMSEGKSRHWKYKK